MKPILSFETVTLFTDKFMECREFYASMLEFPIVFEDSVSAVFDANGAMLNVLAISEAGELVTPQRADIGSGAVGMLLTLVTEDCEACCVTLKARGATILNGPIERPWGRKTAAFADPAGHVWEIAQIVGPSSDD